MQGWSSRLSRLDTGGNEESVQQGQQWAAARLPVQNAESLHAAGQAAAARQPRPYWTRLTSAFDRSFRRRGGGGGGGGGGDGGDVNDGLFASLFGRGRARHGPSHAERQLRSQEAYAALRPGDTAAFIASSSANEGFALELARAEQLTYQKRLDEAAAAHPCAKYKGAVVSLVQHMFRRVTVVTLQNVFIIVLSQFLCSNCGQTFTVNPNSIGCARASAVDDTVWVAHAVLNAAQNSRLIGGQSLQGARACPL